jgi:hypothetical protein
MGAIIGLVVFGIFFWFLWAFISKITGSNIHVLGSKSATWKPDDIDNLASDIRKKIDPKFKRKQEYEEELRKELEPYENAINDIIWQKTIDQLPSKKAIKQNAPNYDERIEKIHAIQRKITKEVEKKYPDIFPWVKLYDN